MQLQIFLFGGWFGCERAHACLITGTVSLISACRTNLFPQCCPKAYAEQYYEDHPSDWANHPPVFLTQVWHGTISVALPPPFVSLRCPHSVDQ